MHTFRLHNLYMLLLYVFLVNIIYYHLLPFIYCAPILHCTACTAQKLALSLCYAQLVYRSSWVRPEIALEIIAGTVVIPVLTFVGEAKIQVCNTGHVQTGDKQYAPNLKLILKCFQQYFLLFCAYRSNN